MSDMDLDPYESCRHDGIAVPHVTDGRSSFCLICKNMLEATQYGFDILRIMGFRLPKLTPFEKMKLEETDHQRQER